MTIVPAEAGPLRVSGNLEIVSGTGRTIDRCGKTALCRCGGSANKLRAARALAVGTRVASCSRPMRANVGTTWIELVEGDIAEQAVDAVVNAAHPDLLGGQGVDGAIHARGGPQIVAACREIGGCPTGRAVITTGGRLPARFVIHTVGPVYDPYGDESPLLASAYRNSLRIAAAYGLASVAFPAISAGAFCFPMALAASVATRAVITFLCSEEHALELVRFVLHPRETRSALATFAEALRAELQPRACVA